jgi:predicted NAD/FAD-dependent oxidoreductase
MNALAKDLARELTVQVNVKISGLSPVRDGWQVTDTEGRIYAARAVLLTAPVPQSLTFLETGRTPMQARDLEALRGLRYTPCLAGLFWLDRPTQLPEPGAIEAVSPRVGWVADNQRKGISPGAAVLTVHAGAEFSLANYEARESEVLALLLDEVRRWLGSAALREAYLKRWRYAQPTDTHPERSLVASGVPPLAFAGDAFGEPRLEGAALSGLDAADKLAAMLT